MNLFWEQDYSKRGYLLPDGCKDLIDVLKLKQQPQPSPPVSPVELVVPEHATVEELARLLNRKPYQIIADLMQLGIFATTKQIIGFDTISAVARKHGFIPKKAA